VNASDRFAEDTRPGSVTLLRLASAERIRRTNKSVPRTRKEKCQTAAGTCPRRSPITIAGRGLPGISGRFNAISPENPAKPRKPTRRNRTFLTAAGQKRQETEPRRPILGRCLCLCLTLLTLSVRGVRRQFQRTAWHLSRTQSGGSHHYRLSALPCGVTPQRSPSGLATPSSRNN
jgi:hypothetical protein